jgi:hypothetical protein
MEKIKLDANDWEILLQGREVKVGAKVLTVKPFSIADAVRLKGVLRSIVKGLAEEGVTAESLLHGEGLDKVFEYIAGNCPIVVEMACGLDRDDVIKLPLSTGITLMTEIINVNVDSQEGMMEALSMLGKLLTTK